MTMRKRMNNMSKSSERVEKKGVTKRDCAECVFFRLLGGRFGVCDKGEHPSDPRECVCFRKQLKRVD